ncbi:hypothetical protein KKF60_02840 [Patescibacteria group bacterium]|nr:hypothetical protein [Patescibacteria group bacterium]
MIISKNQSGFAPVILILIVVVLVVAGGTGYYFYLSRDKVLRDKNSQEQIDETAGWENYRNEQLGFEFKYPASFEISVFQPEIPNSVSGLKITESKKHIGFVFVSHFTQDTNKEMQDFKNYLIKEKEDYPAEKVKIKEFYIGNYPALQYSLINITVSDMTGEVVESPISALETFNDKYSYSIDCLPVNAPCDQILSTFKFTK